MSASSVINGISAQEFFKYIDGGICLLEIGPKIRLIYASAGFYQMLGLSPDDLALPCPLSDIGIYPADAREYERKLRELDGKDEVIRMTQRVSGDGRHWGWRFVRAALMAYPASAYPVVLELSTDNSRHMEQDMKLQENSERLRVAFGQTPNVLWEVDLFDREFPNFRESHVQWEPGGERQFHHEKPYKRQF